MRKKPLGSIQLKILSENKIVKVCSTMASTIVLRLSAPSTTSTTVLESFNGSKTAEDKYKAEALQSY